MNKMRRLECDNCCANGTETTIFGSVYIGNKYCEDCLEIVSDGGGGVMANHKFEPLNQANYFIYKKVENKNI